jgi:hypothetical protein
MRRTILATGLSLSFLAAPAFAADRAAEAAGDKTAPISAESIGVQPTLSAAIASEAASVPLASSSAAVVPSEWRPIRRPSVLPALYVGSALLQAFDAYSTLKAVGMGATEANPVMKGAASNPLALIGVKATVTAASIMAAERMWKNHNRVGAIATMAASNAFMGFVAMHNASVISGLQR